MAADKYKARRQLWRIPEATLLTVAFIGGALGSLLGMLICRHKTKHKKFTIFIPLFLILHMAIIIYMLYSGIIHI